MKYIVMKREVPSKPSGLAERGTTIRRPCDSTCTFERS